MFDLGKICRIFRRSHYIGQIIACDFFEKQISHRILIDINLDNHVYFHFGQNLIALQLHKLDFLVVVLSILSILKKIFMRFVNNGLFDQLHIPIHVHQK